MKNLLILHGSYSNPDKNWYQYVAKNAKQKGYIVHVPRLPHIDRLNLEETYEFLLSQNFINSETVMVGHSSGATYILGILQRLPKDIHIQKAILVAGFVDADLTEKLFKEVPKEHYPKLFPKEWDWEKVKRSCKQFIIIYAPDDPYVQVRHAKILKKKLNGKLVIVPNGKHFSVGSGGDRFKEFPEILPEI